MMKAKAVVFPEPNEVEFRDVECPDPAADDLVVRLSHTWISPGTEGSYLRGERIGGDTPYREGGPWPFPLVPGYQGVGVVEWRGDEIDDIEVGETVFCALGKVNGMYVALGGHVSPAVAPRTCVWKLPSKPDALNFSSLVLTQVGYNSGSRAPLEAGQDAVVIGDGLVGQWATQTLAWRGAQVTMLGTEPERLEMAEQVIACRTINVTTTDWAAALRDASPDGLAVAVDAAGSAESTETIMGLMRRRGHIVSAGFCGTDDRVSLQSLRDSELSIDSVSGWSLERMNHTRDLIAEGALMTLPLVKHHFPVAQAAEAWDVIRDRKTHSLGVILDW